MFTRHKLDTIFQKIGQACAIRLRKYNTAFGKHPLEQHHYFSPVQIIQLLNNYDQVGTYEYINIKIVIEI